MPAALSRQMEAEDFPSSRNFCHENAIEVIAHSSILISALKAASNIRDLETGKLIHGHFLQCGFRSDIYVDSTLLDMYAKCGSLVDARVVFDGIPCRNQVSWNAFILGYVENGEPESALALFSRMQSEGCAPNTQTFVAALKACASLATKEQGAYFSGKLLKLNALEKGMAIHLEVQKGGCDSHKCGSLLDSRRVFDRMDYHSVVSWNSLILGYVDNGEAEIALQLFACMLSQGAEPDPRSFLSTLKAVALLAEKEEGKMVDGNMLKVVSLAGCSF